MAVASRCCLWGKRDDQQSLKGNPVPVADRVKRLNANAGTGAGANLGDHVGNAPTQARKPSPSLPRLLGEAPRKDAPFSDSHQSAEHKSPRPSTQPPQKSPRATHAPQKYPRSSAPPPAQTSLQPSKQTSPQSTAQASPRPSSVSRDAAQECAGPSPESATMIKGSSLEDEVLQWVEAVSGERKGGQPLMEFLKDGQVLCRIANKIQQGICPRINSQSMPFKQMENVTAFIQACRKLGVLEKDVFSTVDLYEGKNPKAVMNCIASLGSVVRRTAPSFQGPYIGVAQNASVTDTARAKAAVTQGSGFRSDIAHEVRAGVTKGRRI